MMMNAVGVQKGMLIAMLGGVVEVESVTPINSGQVLIGVNIGTLHNHKMTFENSCRVDVVDMPENLRGWYGV